MHTAVYEVTKPSLQKRSHVDNNQSLEDKVVTGDVLPCLH